MMKEKETQCVNGVYSYNQLHLIIKFIYEWFVFKLITQFKAMTHLY